MVPPWIQTLGKVSNTGGSLAGIQNSMVPGRDLLRVLRTGGGETRRDPWQDSGGPFKTVPPGIQNSNGARERSTEAAGLVVN